MPRRRPRREFLLGKQLPYVVVSLIQFVTLVALAVFLFHVPIKGSLLTLALGGVIYVLASTGFGLLISVFAATQTAAIFAAAIITILPAVQFSGMFVPVSSLTGGACVRRQDIPQHLFPGDQRRRLHQGAGLRAAVAEHGRARDHRRRLFQRCRSCLLKKQEA